MRDEGGEHLADLVMHHEVGDFVEFGRFPIEDDEAGAVLFRPQGKPRCRPDLPAGPKTAAHHHAAG